MPELPEVETIRRGLMPALAGKRIASVAVRRPDLRIPLPRDLRARLEGKRIATIGRRAKYLLIELETDDICVVHLGMSGRWQVDPGEIGKHDHLILETAAGRVLALNDHRRFGSLDLVATDALADWPTFKALGPEPLSDAFSHKTLATAFEGRSARIKTLLLDQRIVAGLGNIYVCEALFMAGIKPHKPAGQVATARLEPLVQAIKDVLAAAIEAGGSTLRDYARPDGELGYFFKQWRVYGREGKPCRCGQTVMRRVDGGRSTFYCAKCQR